MERLQDVPRQKTRGSMLIVAMGILALMSIMAVTFTRLMKLESDASTNYIDMIRAKLLARSGESRSIVSLRDSASANSFDSIADLWVFKDDGGNLAAGTPIEDATKPSFEGDLGGTYADKGNIYKVKVIDCASQINLNGTQPRLTDMLDNLGAAISRKRGVPDPLTGLEYKGGTGGQAIVTFRSSLVNAKYSSKMQLLELFQENERKKGTTDADKVGLDKFNVFKDYVTANGWLNEKTVKGTQNPDPKIPPLYFPEPRYPVNINTATHEVLVACLQGLAGRGRYVGITERTQRIDQDSPDYADRLPGDEPTALDEIIDFIYVEPLTEGQAEQIASLIENRRASRSFRSHADFEFFVDTIIPTDVLPPYKPSLHPADDRDTDHFELWYKQAGRDMIKANFNPNARPNYFNPSVSARLVADKASLWMKDKDGLLAEAHTTEFCFSSMGYFEITSLGRVLDTREDIVAEAKVRTVVKLFDTIMHTSQREFELAADEDKEDFTTYPLNVVAYRKLDDTQEYGHNEIGYLELSPLEEDSYGMDNSTASLYRLLEIRFDQSKYDSSMGSITGLWIAEGEPGNAMAPQPDPKSIDPKYCSNIEFHLEPKDSDTLPDGLYVSKFKGSSLARLRYRAATPDPGGDSLASNTQGEVNIPMHEGCIEFWIKPEFDSTAKVFAGYLGVSCIGERTVGPDGDTRKYRGGTQMFLFKNTDGSLRMTRLYYEAYWVGTDAATADIYPPKPPYPGDFDMADPRSFPPYEADRPYNPEPPGDPPPKYPIGRPLPDQNDVVHYKGKPIQYARTDILVDHATWGGWKAGEWHHVIIAWDDTANNTDMSSSAACMRLIIDGRTIPGTVFHYAPSKTVLLNEVNPGDWMFVGGICRRQKFPPKGLFKFGGLNDFAVVANATIDNFITYGEGSLIPSTTISRYPYGGTYKNKITIPFPPGVDKVKIRAWEYAAYAPAKYAKTDEMGGGGIADPKDLDDPFGGTAASSLADGNAPGVRVTLYNEGGVEIKPGDNDELSRDPATGAARISYEVDLRALRPVGSGIPLVSPVFDSIQVSYFLPREEVILFEKVVE